MIHAHIPPVAPVDKNVEAVRAKLHERSVFGLRKYGTTTERQDLTVTQWLTHLQEELLDAAVYIEAAKANLCESEGGDHD